MAAPTLNLSTTAILVGGPCKITDGASVYYTEGDCRLEPQPVYRNIGSSVGGEHDAVIADMTWRIGFTPKSYYAYNTLLCPTAYTNWATAGVRMVGASAHSLVVLGSDGTQYTFARAGIVTMPSVYLGLGKSMWGPVEYTAFANTGKALSDADCFVTVATGQAWAQTDYSAIHAAHQESLFSAAWGAVTGMTAMFAEEGFQITHELATEPIKQGNVTVDRKISSYRAMLTFKPQGPTEAQILGAAPFSPAATNYQIGSRLTSNAAANCHDMVLTDGTHTVTLGSVAIQKGAFVFDNKLNRLAEFAFITAHLTPPTATPWRLLFA